MYLYTALEAYSLEDHRSVQTSEQELLLHTDKSLGGVLKPPPAVILVQLEPSLPQRSHTSRTSIVSLFVCNNLASSIRVSMSKRTVFIWDINQGFDVKKNSFYLGVCASVN